MKIGKRLLEHTFSIRGQMVIVFGTVCTIVLTISLYFIYIQTFNIVKQRSEEYTIQQFKQTEYNILNVFLEVNRLSKIFLAYDDVQKYLEPDICSEEDNISYFNSIQKLINLYIINNPSLESILIFTINGDYIGGSDSRTIRSTYAQEQHWFYSTSMYNIARESFPNMCWFGNKEAESYFNEKWTQNTGNYVVSGLRSVKSIQFPQRTAVLVMNIKEEVLASIYSRLSNDSNGKVLIVDGEGIVISSTNTSEIGKKMFSDSRFQSGKQFGSYLVEKNGTPVYQVVYYRISELGWVLVNDIPIGSIYKDLDSIKKIIIAALLASLLLIFFCSILLINRITKPIKQLAQSMKEVGSGRFGTLVKHVPNNELKLLINQFNAMSSNISDLIKRNESVERDKRNLEIRTLQHQIDPHFLYNALNSIKWIAVITKANHVTDALTTLGNIIRPIFREQGVLCRLRDEIEYINNYIRIINLRYGEGIVFEYDVPEELMDYQVLRFLLQPIVENCIDHGLSGKNHTGWIKVRAWLEQEELKICISDNGCGIPVDKLAHLQDLLEECSKNVLEGGYSIGLRNIQQRVLLHFGLKYGIEIVSNEGEGTDVILKLPALNGSADIAASTALL